MSAVPMDSAAFCEPRRSGGNWQRPLTAAGVAVGLHAAVLALLLAGWQVQPPSAPQVRTLTTRLVALAPPAPAAPPQAGPAQAEAPPEPPRPVEAPRPEPRLERQKLEQAALARKRVEEQKRGQQRIERQHREQERQRREAEALAQHQERQRQVEAAEHARAEAAARAAATEHARAEAAAAERARAEAAAAAGQQYLPIAKQAPDYPESALDKGLEGDCTVSYRVNSQGRVEDPQIVGDCHPLFVRPSLAAARTFRYQPRIVNGQAVAVHGVKNTFHYRIQE